MNRLYIIQTDIKNNEVFNQRLKSLGGWMRYFSDNWIIESPLSAKEIYNQISVGYENESIFIIEIQKNNYWGRMNKTVWDFLQKKQY